jgi:hypothetical protein
MLSGLGILLALAPPPGTIRGMLDDRLSLGACRPLGRDSLDLERSSLASDVILLALDRPDRVSLDVGRSSGID